MKSATGGKGLDNGPVLLRPLKKAFWWILDSTHVSSLDLVDFCPVLDVGQIDLSQVGTAQICLVDPIIACDPLVRTSHTCSTASAQ